MKNLIRRPWLIPADSAMHHNDDIMDHSKRLNSYKRLYVSIILKRQTFADYVNDNKHCPDDRAIRVLEIIDRAKTLVERLIFPPEPMPLHEEEAAKETIQILVNDANAIANERSSLVVPDRIPMKKTNLSDEAIMAEYNHVFL